MKYLFYIITIAVIFSVLMASCAPKEQAAEAEEAPAEEAAGEEAEAEAPAEERTLVMLDWAGYELEDFWGDFKEAYPDVKVEFSFLTESAGSRLYSFDTLSLARLLAPHDINASYGKTDYGRNANEDSENHQYSQCCLHCFCLLLM